VQECALLENVLQFVEKNMNSFNRSVMFSGSADDWPQQPATSWLI